MTMPTKAQLLARIVGLEETMAGLEREAKHHKSTSENLRALLESAEGKILGLKDKNLALEEDLRAANQYLKDGDEERTGMLKDIERLNQKYGDLANRLRLMEVREHALNVYAEALEKRGA
jgi:phage shock protein A